MGDRHAAVQPIYDAVVQRWGHLAPDVARGVAVRHDWGRQCRSVHFYGSPALAGHGGELAYLGEPQTNGCAERWIKTLKEQCLWARLHEGLDDLRRRSPPS